MKNNNELELAKAALALLDEMERAGLSFGELEYQLRFLANEAISNYRKERGN